MKTLLLLCFLNLGSLGLCDKYTADEIESQYTAKFQNANFSNITEIESQSLLTVADCKISEENCPLFFTVPSPSNVHDLSPSYVGVVAAMGDSVTAGMAAKAKSLLGIATDYRGVSWSIGGDNTLEEGVVTLPNILKKFSVSELKGFSIGTGKKDSPNAKLNVAMSGDFASGLEYQAKRLVTKFYEMDVRDEDWKVITIWIGSNDLCSTSITCDGINAEENAVVYVKEVERALDFLREHVTRAFINLVSVINVAEILKIEGPNCELSNFVGCRCALNDKEIVTVSAELYNKKLQELIEDGKYDHENFTVVLQPFLSKAVIPEDRKKSLRAIFSPDCFHFNMDGHKLMATYLWNNMFQVVGGKTDRVDWDSMDDTTCMCPDSPYFATARNSVNKNRRLLGSANSNEPGFTRSNLLGILLGTCMGVVFIAVLVVAVSVGVIRRRRKRREQSERIHLIFSKN